MSAKGDDGYGLKEKTFVARDCLLVELYGRSETAKYVYRFILVILFSVLVNDLARFAIFQESRLGGILGNFFDFHLAIQGWLWISCFNLFVYVATCIWCFVYDKHKHQIFRYVWGKMGVVAYVFYLLFSIHFSAGYVTDGDMSLASSIALLSEQVRLLMKAYAFVRTNVTKTLKLQEQQNVEKLRLPSVKNYVYFLFAPTLIYRDSYPRTKVIRWRIVLLHAFEVVAIVVLASHIIDEYMVPVCKDFQNRKHSISDIVWVHFANTLPVLSLKLMCFYLIIHAWLNAFAEVTRFGDRQFYHDWWNSRSMSSYYRKWNTIVHDFLYEYGYKDFYRSVTPGNQMLSKLLVFLASSVFHEYVIYFTLRIFHPAMFVMFFFVGPVFSLLRIPSNSMLLSAIFLYSIALGSSIVTNSYLLEYCVRWNPCAANATTSFVLLSEGCLLR